MKATLLARQRVDLGDLRRAGAAMLGAAAVLPMLPDGTGLPCPLRTLTGVPCPLCGMTTSVTATVHGDVAAALAANPAGIAAVALAVGLLIAWRTKAVRVPAATVPLALLAMWVFELLRFDVF